MFALMLATGYIGGWSQYKMQESYAVLNKIRNGIHSHFIRLDSPAHPHLRVCKQICSLEVETQAFYRIWEDAQVRADYINKEAYPGLIPTDRTLNNPEWMAITDASLGRSVEKFCRLVGIADKRQIISSREVSVDGLYRAFTADAFLVSAMIDFSVDPGHQKLSPSVYVGPGEIAIWRRDYPDISRSAFNRIVGDCYERKHLVPRQLACLASQPPGRRQIDAGI